MARRLAQRIADQLSIPCYSYEASALKPERKNLAVCRRGEYEAIPQRISNPDEQPDWGARPYDDGVARTGCTVVGARDFLVAVNYNLNTTSTRRANAIAFDVREKGRPGQPGTLPGTKAIGWYIDEYGIAQVSMNITDINRAPLHRCFDEVCRAAQNRGLRVTGTEIVGLVPKRVLTEAGRYYLQKQNRSTGIPEEDIINIAVKSMSLDDLAPFNPRAKVIEFLLEDADRKKNGPLLVEKTVREFAQETSRESPAPGGGTVAAYMGALGAALGTMVANLSSHKRGWDDRCPEFAAVADKGQQLLAELLRLVDDDTKAFNRIMEAFAMPKGTTEEQTARDAAIQQATRQAADVPLQTMKASMGVFPICRAMAEDGNPASVSDAGVGALAARAAVMAAGLNVKINAASLEDAAVRDALAREADELMAQACKEEQEIIDIVNSKIQQ